MKNIKFILLGLCVAICIVSIVFVKALAQEETTDDVSKQYSDVKEEIERLQRQLNSLQSQERTLSNQISQFNSQIEVTTLRIAEVRQEIEKLAAEISVLQSQVDGLEITLEKISSILAERAVATYQRGEVTPLKLLVAADGFDTFLTRYAYMSYMQSYDKQALLELQQNQNDINTKKIELEDKKKQIEERRKKLEDLKLTLDSQKKAKETLLQVTKNDEVKYAKLLEAARSREQQLAQLIFKDGKVSYSLPIYGLSKQGSIAQGSRVGTMGNSGAPRCSTAAHLHVETIANGKLTDSALIGDLISPYAYLKSRQISYFQDDNSISVSSFGAGSWDWPLSNPVITQQFGKTKWSSRYLSGFHTGVDMVDYNDRTVRAPASGTLYYAKVACGNPINIAIIDHGGDVFSDFLHLE
jgi:peptidoglycan hydrolase CwlO-like protein